ncbi:MAG: ABC transporter ATP-binding protein [Acutalibacteraceae bacterium]
MADDKTIRRGTVKKVLKYVSRYSPLIVLSLVFSVITVALTLYVPILIGRAVDLMITKDRVDFAGIAEILLKTGAAVGATALLQWIMNTVNNRITFEVVRDMRNEAFEKIEALPLSYIDSHPHGDTVSRVIADADQFADGLLMGFTQLFTGIMTILGTLIFMFSISRKIALVVVLLTPISLFAAKFISSKTYNMFHLQSVTRGEQTAFIDESVQNEKVIKAFSWEEETIKKFDEINERLEKHSLRATFFSSLVNPSTRFINSVVYAGVGLAGALACVATAGSLNPFTVGELSCFLSYANQYTKPFNEISGVVTELQNALACASRIFELIEEKPQPADSENEVLTKVNGNVALKEVSFSYTEGKSLIENLNLSAKPGQKIAIVGPTGCGKTTIINLLMRFYDVCGGAIFVEGKDIRNVTRHSLRSSYGMVLQETWLKEATVKENIRLSKPDASDDEVIAAAKAAHADGFIRRLEKGYDTVISDEKGGLSQGQKQLLCIARVMLCLPPMLILDEATSSIDTRTELKISEAFNTMMKGRTSFIVAHRLSTIREADVILVMKNGRIIEQGNHEELLQKNGFYAELYNSQFAS